MLSGRNRRVHSPPRVISNKAFILLVYGVRSIYIGIVTVQSSDGTFHNSSRIVAACQERLGFIAGIRSRFSECSAPLFFLCPRVDGGRPTSSGRARALTQSAASAFRLPKSVQSS